MPAETEVKNELLGTAVPLETDPRGAKFGRPKPSWDKRLQGGKQAARGAARLGPARPVTRAQLEARGCSSDGRALQSHCRGQGFDSPQLPQPSLLSPLRLPADPGFLNGKVFVEQHEVGT